MTAQTKAGSSTINQLIINSPYQEPSSHWRYHREKKTFTREAGRRPAGYVRASESSKAFDDPGVFVELPLVNKIRPRVKAWREADYPGVTGITKRLLEHWNDPEQRENHRLFFCQLEAVETMIWLAEAPAAERVGIEIPGDGRPFARICCKMATGSGKTIVMAMLIAWQVLNKVTYPQDKRFSKNIFVVAPGLTVKNRLRVLELSGAGNFYAEFSLIPQGLGEKLRQGQVRIANWHTLDWDTDEQLAKRKTVDKRGALSDEAYVRDVLDKMASAQNIVVINDEAHHAWRVPPKARVPGVSREELEEATKWVGGLDRIHRARGILSCFDLTATPFAPTGRRSGEETLFPWIASDFGLNDAIESGLVKTPRVVIRDDGRLTEQYKSRFYHIYMDSEVKDDINRKAEPQIPLPDLVTTAYHFLGKDWQETAKLWQATGFPTPPVMITVANRTETAARINYALTHEKIHIDELSKADRILHIDSRVLGEAEAQQEAPEDTSEDNDPDEGNGDGDSESPRKKLTRKQRAEQLRQIVDTVGQVGKPGEKIQAVISVGMLSEGWDAKTVTHIMGLRAFTSQLLCEQVVGRGLRRTSYELKPGSELFEAEYVNIFGVPFTFIPHEGGEDTPPPSPPDPKDIVEPLPDKKQFEITWPNVIRIDHGYRPELSLDLAQVKPLALDAYKTPMIAELAPMIDGKPDVTRLSSIDLEELGRKFRLQRIIFEAARDVYDQMQPTWKGNRDLLLAQVIRMTEKYISSGHITISPPLFNQDDARRRILLTLNMNKIVQNIWEAIRFENTLALSPIFDSEKPIRSTGDMQQWFTGRPNEVTKRSHINRCVYDSRWEASESFELDRNADVDAWVKNDHLGFEVHYIYKGVVHKFRPDFLVRLACGKMLVLEVKGQDTQESKTKREFLAEWIKAVNDHGGFGMWASDVSHTPPDLGGILRKHNA
jgi:type III restriction enzyme